MAIDFDRHSAHGRGRDHFRHLRKSDVRWCRSDSGSCASTFPGPAYGGPGLRALTNWDHARWQGRGDTLPTFEPAFGTILKPTAGITPDQVGKLVEEAAACPLFLFVKEDENLYPRLDYSPVKERARRAADAIRRAQDKRGGKGLVFAPHITGAPHEILESVHAVIEAERTA